MSISCPNKRLVAWKNLVKNVGENRSFLLWAEYDGNVPDKYYESNIKSEQVNQIEEKVNFNNLIGSKKNEVVSENNEIVDEIRENVSKWRILAKEIGISRADQELMEEAFIF